MSTSLVVSCYGHFRPVDHVVEDVPPLQISHIEANNPGHGRPIMGSNEGGGNGGGGQSCGEMHYGGWGGCVLLGELIIICIGRAREGKASDWRASRETAHGERV